MAQRYYLGSGCTFASEERATLSGTEVQNLSTGGDGKLPCDRWFWDCQIWVKVLNWSRSSYFY